MIVVFETSKSRKPRYKVQFFNAGKWVNDTHHHFRIFAVLAARSWLVLNGTEARVVDSREPSDAGGDS